MREHDKAIINETSFEDIHQRNSEKWGCSKEEAKIVYYGLAYGASTERMRQFIADHRDNEQKKSQW